MDITVTGRKMQLTEALRDYAQEKAERALGVFAIDPLSADVVLHVEKNRKNPKTAVAEITVFTKGHVIRAEEAADDMYAALDLACEKVERQLRKFKTRILDKRKRAPHGGIAAAEALAVEPIEEEHESEIIRRKTIEPKPMSEAEAMLQIDLLGHDFFVYIDDESGAYHVMYLRDDGGYGILATRK